MDLHEFLVTPQGDAYIVGVSPIHYGTMKRPLMDAVVQEIDIKTGLVLFEWHALDHIPITESFFKNGAPGAVFDPYHLNSVALDTDGNLIVSVRNTWAVYKIDHQTGAVMWTLGSNQNSFKMGPGTQTAFQHDVVLQPNGMLTMFDDGAGPPRVHSQSRALEESINETNKTVTLVRQFEHSPGLSANFEGGAQVLPGGDLLVGWGQQPYFTEFNSAGQEVFDARFTSNTSSYRAYKFAWNGQPTTPPAIAAASNNDGTTQVWASWNGATAVSSWRVLAGSSSSSLATLQTVPKQGFETAISAPTGMGDFEVQALDSSGNVLVDLAGGDGSAPTSGSPAVRRSCRAAAPAGCRRSATTAARVTSRSRSPPGARSSPAPAPSRSRRTAAGSSTSR